MMEYFRRLAPREQIVLGAGAALAVIIIAWSFVWTPLQSAVGELRESVGDRSRLMVDLRRASQLPASSVPVAAGADAQELHSLVNATAGQIGLASSIPDTRPEANGGAVRVSLQNAPFALLLDWLIGLDREHGVQAGVVNLRSANGQPGLVSGTIVLSRT